MKAYALKPLIADMQRNDIFIEHYSFTYNGHIFDVVISVKSNGYEILIGVHKSHWGCVLSMDKTLEVNMPDKIYYSLRDILDLKYSDRHFNSFEFLLLLSKSAPKKSACTKVDLSVLRSFTKYRPVDENDKIYFIGWNTHIKDKRQARNFDKTEFFFGKDVADYCRAHNISSLWTSDPAEEKPYSNPSF